jgi:hypothetical protein
MYMKTECSIDHGNCMVVLQESRFQLIIEIEDVRSEMFDKLTKLFSILVIILFDENTM